MGHLALLLILGFSINSFADTQRNLPAYADEPLKVQKQLKAVAKKKTQSEIEEKIREERAQKRNPSTESEPEAESDPEFASE